MKACLIVFAAFFSPTAVAASACPYSRAHYSTPTGDLALDFLKISPARGMVSDLALRVRAQRSAKDVAYYYFDQGSAPKITLISTTDVSARGWRVNPDGGIRPHGTATFIGMAADGRLEQTAPTSKTMARRFLIIPELGQVLKASGISVRRDDAFVLASCKRD